MAGSDFSANIRRVQEFLGSEKNLTYKLLSKAVVFFMETKSNN